MTTAVENEIKRLQKMIDRKTEEIKEHEELITMWKEKDKKQLELDVKPK